MPTLRDALEAALVESPDDVAAHAAYADHLADQRALPRLVRSPDDVTAHDAYAERGQSHRRGPCRPASDRRQPRRGHELIEE
jgi:uncharacterized protein (TIGR02996 family)